MSTHWKPDGLRTVCRPSVEKNVVPTDYKFCSLLGQNFFLQTICSLLGQHFFLQTVCRPSGNRPQTVWFPVGTHLHTPLKLYANNKTNQTATVSRAGNIWKFVKSCVLFPRKRLNHISKFFLRATYHPRHPHSPETTSTRRNSLFLDIRNRPSGY